VVFVFAFALVARAVFVFVFVFALAARAVFVFAPCSRSRPPPRAVFVFVKGDTTKRHLFINYIDWSTRSDRQR